MYHMLSVNSAYPESNRCRVCNELTANKFCHSSHREFFRRLAYSAYSYFHTKDKEEAKKKAKELNQLGYAFIRNRNKRVSMKHYHTWVTGLVDGNYYVVQWMD